MFKAAFVLALGLAVLVAAGPVTAGQSAQNAPAQAKGTQAGAVLDLNAATIAQLEALPGVGAKLAERILQYRQKNGRFNKIEDLMNVQGIGEKNFLRLKPLVTVAPPQKDELAVARS